MPSTNWSVTVGGGPFITEAVTAEAAVPSKRSTIENGPEWIVDKSPHQVSYAVRRVITNEGIPTEVIATIESRIWVPPVIGSDYQPVKLRLRAGSMKDNYGAVTCHKFDLWELEAVRFCCVKEPLDRSVPLAPSIRVVRG